MTFDEIKLEELPDLDEYVGSYIDVTLPNGDGAAGTAIRIGSIREYRGFMGRWIYLDWGMQWFACVGSRIEIFDRNPNGETL